MSDNDSALILAVSAIVGAALLLQDDQGGGLLGGLAIGLPAIGTPASAAAQPVQQSPSVSRNYASVVAAARQQLIDQGADLSGPDGAFLITQLSAQLIGGDCGLLDKPSGNNSHGFAVDIHAWRDGFHYDVLGDGGGANNPQYNLVGPYDVSRWRQP